jgi:hypothetical protein
VSAEPLTKIDRWDGEDWVPVRYGDVWVRQKTSGPERLAIAPSEKPLDVMRALAEAWQGGYFLLYVLLIPRREDHPAGRYQSPGPLSFAQVTEFCETFGAFLESDGRHHFWIGSVGDEGILVYDQHGVLYAYGDLPRYIDLLTARGFGEGEVRFPAPHRHHYHPANNAALEAMLAYWEWGYFPLQPGDER